MSDFQYVSVTAPVLTPATVDAPQTCDRWKPTYPDRIDRAKIPAWAHLFPPQNLLPILPPSRAGGASIIPAGSYDLWQYTPEVGPLDVPSSIPVDVIQWQGHQPSQLVQAKSMIAAQRRSWTMDQFDPPGVVTAPSVAGLDAVYPDHVAGRRLHTGAIQTFTIDSIYTSPPQPPQSFNFRGYYPDRHWRIFRQATYVWGQPMFAYEVDVPVESWTGWYLDPPVLPKFSPVRSQQLPNPGFVPDVTVTAPTLSWMGRYRDYVPRHPVPPRGPTSVGPIFIADITVGAPTLSAQAIYPASIDRLRALATPQQHEFFMDRFTAPVAPTAPALSVAVYPNRIYARGVPTVHPDVWMPAFVLDVTAPAPTLSWIPVYPNQILKPLPEQTRPYLEPEITWYLQFPLYLFRPEWAVNSNQLIGISTQPIKA